MLLQLAHASLVATLMTPSAGFVVAHSSAARTRKIRLQDEPPLPITTRLAVGPLDTLTSGLASIARLPYGTDVAPAIRDGSWPPAGKAEPELVLYEFEGCPFCRRVREVVTYLDLTCTVKPCARGSRHRAEVVSLSGKAKPTYPYLVDKTAGTAMFESQDICEHLIATYGGDAVGTPPAPEDYFYTSTFVTGWIPSLFRLGRGGAVEDVMVGKPAPAQLLTLYSYDGNQFCRFVREVLTELDIPYQLRSTGKGSPRREELGALSGKTTAPFLVDPNTGKQMGESADIVQYLLGTYAM